MRAAVLAAILIALGACTSVVTPPGSSPTTSAAPTATATAAVTASPSVAASPSTASPSPAGPAEIAVPLDAARFARIADDEVLITTRLSASTLRIEASDLSTGAVSLVREGPIAGVQISGLRDGVIAFADFLGDAPGQAAHMRVFAGRWRDPSTLTLLDDLVIPIIGGDAWNPLPLPQTNGWEVVWMHAPLNADYELRMREADGRIHAIFSSKRPFSFALARDGSVAIGDIAILTSQTDPLALRLYSAGATRVLVERPVSNTSSGGIVYWVGGRIAWSNNLGLVVPMTSAELIFPRTLVREIVTPPQGCSGYGGATEDQLAFLCIDHIELRSGPGPTRVGPPFPLVSARAIVRTVDGPPKVAYVTRVVTNELRAGAGARF